MSKAEHRALKWLASFPEGARIDGYGRMIAGDGSRSSAQAQTFLRLFLRGFVDRAGMPGTEQRLVVAQRGELALSEASA